MAVPSTTLAITDRLAVKLYATNSGGKTTTIHTQNGHLCQIITTFSTGITALNGLTTQVQYFATGTSGTDFNISSTTATHTFNLPTASATNRGALSSTDWSTFNNKQNALTNPVTGTSVTSRIAYFNGTSSITGSSNLNFDGTNLLIGNVTTGLAQLHVYNASAAATILLQTNSTTDYSEIAVRNDSSTATSYFRQYSTAATGSDFGISRAGLALFFSNYATNFAIGTRNGGSLIFGTADTERMRINTSGNVGIGTASPSYKLDTYGTSGTTSLRVRDGNLTATAQILLECANTFSGTSQAFINAVGTNGGNNSIDLLFGTSSGGSSASERMRITSGGNVGIGTSSPSSKLSIVKGTSDGAIANFTGASGEEIAFGINSTENYIYTTANGKGLTFYVDDTERMRITSGGQILFGSTSTPYNTALFRSSYGSNTYFSFGPNNNSNSWVLWNDSGSGVYLTSGNSSWSSASDERLKNINSNIDNAVEKLMTLRTVNFSWKSDETNKENLGLIAQDVQKVFPQIIDKNTLPNEINESTEYLGVRYVELVPVLIAAIQELKQEIDELKNK
jgi:hypothetical protein